MTNESPPLHHRLLADLSLLVITAIWGSTFIMVDKAIETINVLVFLFYRFTIAFIVLLIIFGYRLLKIRIHWRDIWPGIVIGVFLFAGYSFQTFGLDLGTDPGKTAFITGLYVVLVPLFASFILRKKPHYLSWIGIIVAVVGLGLLSIESFSSFQFSDIFSDLLVLIGAVAFAFHIISIDKFVGRIDYSILTIVQIGTTAILAGTTALIMGFVPSILKVPVLPIIFNNQVIFAIIFTGIIATALILAMQTFAQKKTSPTHVALIFAMEPVFGALFAILFAGEILLPRQWIGCALILVSMIFQQLVDLKLAPILKEKKQLSEIVTEE